MSNFEDIIKEKANQFEAPYNEAHWLATQKKLKIAKTNLLLKKVFYTVITVSAISTIGYFIFSPSIINEEKSISSLPNNTISNETPVSTIHLDEKENTFTKSKENQHVSKNDDQKELNEFRFIKTPAKEQTINIEGSGKRHIPNGTLLLISRTISRRENHENIGKEVSALMAYITKQISIIEPTVSKTCLITYVSSEQNPPESKYYNKEKAEEYQFMEIPGGFGQRFRRKSGHLSVS